MQYGNEDYMVVINRFESMLKTNDIVFFDSNEFEEIANHYIENGKMALARKAVKLGLDQHPDSSNLWLYKAEIFIFEDKFDKAEELLDELLELEPHNEEIFIQKANILSKKDRHSEAVALLEIALEYTDDPSDVYSLIGMEYLFLEDLQKAKYSFMQCLEVDDQDYSALYNVIYCFEFLEEHKEAIDYLNLFLDKNPYCEVAWHQIGKQYFDLKQLDKALAAFDFAIISDDRFVGAYLEKGKVLEKLGRVNEAIECYQMTLDLEDPTSFALLRMGKCYEKLGLDDSTLEYYNKCVHEDPLLDSGWIAITDFYSAKLDYQKSLYYINKALNIDPENILYWRRYAKINLRLNFLEEAEYGFRRTIELGAYEEDIWLQRCDILLRLGEHEAAINTCTQSLEFYPESAELLFRISGLNYDKGDDIQGQYFLKNALKIDPEFIIVLEELFPYAYQKKSVQKILKDFK